MAIQKKGPKLSGKVGDKIYAAVKSGTVVKGQSKKEHKLSEGSARSGKDLAEVSTHSKNVRLAYVNMVKDYGDDELYHRLNARFYDVIRPLPKMMQGKKKVKDGDISALVGFQFNTQCTLNNLLFRIPNVHVDTSGILTIDLQVGNTENITAAIAGFNQVMLQLSVLSYDFNTANSSLTKMGDLVGSTLKSAKKKIELDLSGELLLLVVIGVQYVVNGYRSYSKDKFAAGITHAFVFKDGKPVVFKPVLEKAEQKVEANNNELAWDE